MGISKRLLLRGLAGTTLSLVVLSGCQTYTGGMTLPSPHYLKHYPQYFAPDPAFSSSANAIRSSTRPAKSAAALRRVHCPARSRNRARCRHRHRLRNNSGLTADRDDPIPPRRTDRPRRMDPRRSGARHGCLRPVRSSRMENDRWPRHRALGGMGVDSRSSARPSRRRRVAPAKANPTGCAPWIRASKRP